METCSRLRQRQGAALFMILVAAVLGCFRAGPVRTSPEAVVAEPPGEEVRLPPPPRDTPPLPTEAELALKAAEDAETSRDLDRAEVILTDALATAEEPVMTEIHFRLARLYLDPVREDVSVERARSVLQTIVETAPGHPRHPDARAMLWLIEDAARSRGEAAEVTAENQELRARLASLKTDLEGKEQQLERIKQVLLQTKP